MSGFDFNINSPNQFEFSICKVIRRLETVAHYSFVIVTGTGMPVHQSITKKGILFQFFIFTAIFFILIMNWKRKQNMIFFSIYSMMLIHIVSPPKYNAECKRQLKRVKTRNINRRNFKKKIKDKNYREKMRLEFSTEKKKNRERLYL
jgi:hypothetical protein